MKDGLRRGEAHPRAKLTEVDAIEARRLYFKEGWTQKQIAEKLNISQSQIQRIINGYAWKHVGGGE